MQSRIRTRHDYGFCPLLSTTKFIRWKYIVNSIVIIEFDDFVEFIALLY